MRDDLVRRGRLLACPDQYQRDIVDEMADRIEELEAALRPFAFPSLRWGSGVSYMELPVAPEWIDAARAALDGTPEEQAPGNCIENAEQAER